jgi:hypothetical protein
VMPWVDLRNSNRAIELACRDVAAIGISGEPGKARAGCQRAAD